MKKVFIFLFVGMLVIYQPIEVYADASSLVVAGGSIGTGGLAVAGMAGLSGPAVVILFTALMACGMNVELTRASQEAGMSKTEFVKNKVKQYCNDANITLGTFCNYILSETKIAKNGLIELGSQAKSQIIQFGNWLFNQDYVSDSDIPDLTYSYVDISSYRFPVLNSGDTIKLSETTNLTINNSNFPVGIFLKTNNNDTGIILFNLSRNIPSNRTFTVSIGNSTYSPSSITGPVNGYKFYYFSKNIGNELNENIYCIPLSGSVSTFLENLDGTFNIITPSGTATDSFTGSSSDWENTKGNINTGVLNPGLNPGLDIPQDSDLTTSVQDYMDALKDVIDGVANPDITVRDQVTGIPVDIPIDVPAVDDPALENPDPTIPDEDKTPVIDPSTPADPNVALEPLTIQLKGVFPFCIPFDYVDMLKLLNSSAVAPTYTVNWTIPIVNTNLNFTVDLSPYNNVASILRKMELLAFCVALAIATRAMFIRG